MPRQRISAEVIDAARAVYVASANATSVKDLAKESGVALRTLARRSVDEGCGLIALTPVQRSILEAGGPGA